MINYGPTLNSTGGSKHAAICIVQLMLNSQRQTNYNKFNSFATEFLAPFFPVPYGIILLMQEKIMGMVTKTGISRLLMWLDIKYAHHWICE